MIFFWREIPSWTDLKPDCAVLEIKGDCRLKVITGNFQVLFQRSGRGSCKI
jgi:hypothetical protein